jgi:hypothetical protein
LLPGQYPSNRVLSPVNLAERCPPHPVDRFWAQVAGPLGDTLTRAEFGLDLDIDYFRWRCCLMLLSLGMVRENEVHYSLVTNTGDDSYVCMDSRVVLYDTAVYRYTKMARE